MGLGRGGRGEAGRAVRAAGGMGGAVRGGRGGAEVKETSAASEVQKRPHRPGVLIPPTCLGRVAGRDSLSSASPTAIDSSCRQQRVGAASQRASPSNGVSPPWSSTPSRPRRVSTRRLGHNRVSHLATATRIQQVYFASFERTTRNPARPRRLPSSLRPP